MIDGNLELFFIENDGSLPDWTSQIASFNRKHVLSHTSSCAQIPEAIQSVIVQVDAVEKVLDEAGPLDVLIIDAEGYDHEILSAIPCKRLPDFVSFEYSHMSSEEWRSIHTMLKYSGFTVWVYDRDVVASRVRRS